MKRTCLFLLLVVALLWPLSNMAQGPLSVQVNPVIAAQFIAEHPEFTNAFIFDAKGGAKCTEQHALRVYNKCLPSLSAPPADVSSLGAPNKTSSPAAAPGTNPDPQAKDPAIR